MARYLITARDAAAPRCETQRTSRCETQATAYWSLGRVRTFDAAQGVRRIAVLDSAADAPISRAELVRRAQGELDELGIRERV